MKTQPPILKVIKIDETQSWNDQIVAIGKRLFTYYLYDESEHTYCVEITPSYYLKFLSYEAQEVPEGEDARDAFLSKLDEVAYNSDDKNIYVHCRQIDRAAETSKTDCDVLTFEEWVKDRDEDETEDERYDAFIEEVTEYLSGNPIYIP